LKFFLENHFPHFSDKEIQCIVKEYKKTFLSQFNSKYRSVYYKKDIFRNKYSDWLEGSFLVKRSCNDHDSAVESSIRVSGRPVKNFEECCDRSKKIKVRRLQDNFSQALIDAAASSSSSIPSSAFDADSALGLVVQAKLTKYQYEVLRKATKAIGHDIFPSYKKVTEARKRCYPDNVIANETSARVPLQDLLDHTCKRIIQSDETLQPHHEDHQFSLHTKWGCDGASGQSRYMQSFTISEEGVSDKHLFQTSVVPLKLVQRENQEIVWKNPRPSSTRYCRALQFSFSKETPEVVREEWKRVQSEIQDLRDTEIECNGHMIRINHILHSTMIDGKIATIITNTTSSSNCTICGAKPSEMNQLAKLQQKPCNSEGLKLGMSTLHARIRFMEFVLYLSYNLPFKAWRTSNLTAEIKQETKKYIQDQFKRRLGLLVDIVKQGTGTTNCGNTSRRFFQNYSVTAEITKIDENLIK